MSTAAEQLSAMFDASFFADYAQQLEDISLEDQAAAALADILTVKTQEGTTRNYEQIRDEAEIFFANPLVQETTQLLDSLAMQYMQFCMDHGEGAEIMNEGSLGNLFRNSSDEQGHDHNHADDHASKSSVKAAKEKRKNVRLPRSLLAILTSKL